MIMKIYSVGTLAYYDSLYCMVKCKVTAINGIMVTVKVTAPIRGHKVGEEITVRNYNIVPRTSVFYHNYHMMIRNDYIWR